MAKLKVSQFVHQCESGLSPSTLSRCTAWCMTLLQELLERALYQRAATSCLRHFGSQIRWEDAELNLQLLGGSRSER